MAGLCRDSLLEEHVEHVIVGLWRQVGEEEDVVGRLLV